MSAPAPYVLGDLEAQPGSQVRGYCRVNLGPDTVALMPTCIGCLLGCVLALPAVRRAAYRVHCGRA